MEDRLEEKYGHRVRVRACGVYIESGRLLMINHKGITENNFWAPPGGGIEFGDTIGQTLAREFEEETGLIIKPGDFLFGCEYIRMPIHAIELFYSVERIGGTLKTGADPEIQIIEDVRFMSFGEIAGLPENEVHGIFRTARTLAHFGELAGFYTI